MFVVINELEIVLPQPKPSGAAAGPRPPSAPPPQLAPRDIADVDERRARLDARLRAY